MTSGRLSRQIRTIILTAATLAFLCVSHAALAQEEVVESSFSVQNFKISPGANNFLTLDGAKVGRHLQFTVEMMNVFQYKPYIVVTCKETSEEGKCEIDEERVSVVEFHDSLELAASLSIFNWVDLGLVLPFTVYQKGEKIDPELAISGGDLESWGGMGDPRLHIKARLYGEPGTDGFGLALSPVLTFPVGGYGPWADSYVGDKMVTVHGRLALDYTWKGLHAGINVGYLWREKIEVFGTKLEDQLTYGMGIGYRAHRYVGILAELFGSVALSREGYYKGIFTDNRAEMPLEADGAVQIFPIPDLRLTVGGGAGIISAVGSPVFRVFLGLAYVPVGKEVPKEVKEDRDGDGIKNKLDQCPDEPEDFDKFEDEDGCPDNDNDGDGVLDGYDSCPLEPEDKDGFDDDDGCPDYDMDKDGIPDEDDGCPEEPEDKDGFQDEDGCPEEDNDKDGLPDGDDLCPNDPEDMDGYNDADGCPDLDNDEDGIPDKDDQCPEEAEIFNGVKDDDGCPDKGKALVVITGTQIEIKQKINFATNSDKIKGKKSFQILDIVAHILKANPSISVEVQGHTDNKGKHDYNVDLSQRRAESVKAYLVEQGVDEWRLKAVGYGPDKPIASNATKKGRDENRRVEFHIIEGTQEAETVVKEVEKTEGEPETKKKAKESKEDEPYGD
jgi:outer membrane protein OmpA-like peptidoglycan-associated protein